MLKTFSASNLCMLQPFNKRHTALNRPRLEEPLDTLTIRTAVTARPRDLAEKLGT